MTKELRWVDELTVDAEKADDVIELLEILVEDMVSHHNADMVSRNEMTYQVGTSKAPRNGSNPSVGVVHA